ncbi:MAG: hypothetical protein ABIV28_05035 [Longimicrobiales bacterium]
MNGKTLLTIVFAGGLFVAGCDSSPIAPDANAPQYDGIGKKKAPTTTSTTTTTTTTQSSTGDNIGDPCDPETYSGQYRCIPDPNVDGGYIIAS